MRALMVFMLVGVVACDGLIGDVPMTGDDDPEASGARHARRVSAPQLRQAIVTATGFDYVGSARVADPSSPQGSVVRDDAPLLEVYGASLGNPDYNYTTQASLDASITFSKLAEDGVRYACRQVAEAEVVLGAHPSGRAHLLLDVDRVVSLPADETSVRGNIAELALHYWGHVQEPSDEDTSALLDVFRAGYDAGTPAVDPEMPEDELPPDPVLARNAGGWRAVCIAMLSDPRFLTY